MSLQITDDAKAINLIKRHTPVYKKQTGKTKERPT